MLFHDIFNHNQHEFNAMPKVGLGKRKVNTVFFCDNQAGLPASC